MVAPHSSSSEADEKLNVTFLHGRIALEYPNLSLFLLTDCRDSCIPEVRDLKMIFKFRQEKKEALMTWFPHHMNELMLYISFSAVSLGV